VHWAATVISIGALAGLTTVVMVLVLGQTRVLFAMSRDGLLPRPLAKTGPHGTPVRITVLVAVLVAVSASVFPIDKLEEMVNVGTLFAFILVSAGVIVLRRSRPDLERGFTVPGVPWLPVASIIACLWLMLNLTALTWIRFLIWMVLGVGVYWLYGRRHSRFAADRVASHAEALYRTVRATSRGDGTIHRLSSRLNRRRNHSPSTGSVSAAPRNWSNRLPTGRYHAGCFPEAPCRMRSPIAFMPHREGVLRDRPAEIRRQVAVASGQQPLEFARLQRRHRHALPVGRVEADHRIAHRQDAVGKRSSLSYRRHRLVGYLWMATSPTGSPLRIAAAIWPGRICRPGRTSRRSPWRARPSRRRTL
jgi:hypothetical protein